MTDILKQIKSLEVYKNSSIWNKLLWSSRCIVLHNVIIDKEGMPKGKLRNVFYHPITLSYLILRLIRAIALLPIMIFINILIHTLEFFNDTIYEFKQELPSLKTCTLDCRNKYKEQDND